MYLVRNYNVRNYLTRDTNYVISLRVYYVIVLTNLVMILRNQSYGKVIINIAIVLRTFIGSFRCSYVYVMYRFLKLRMLYVETTK